MKIKDSDFKVYDCFTFFNELDLLEIRLNELDNVVDFFVLVESSYTHQGKPKALLFEENKARFNQFLHKIIHVVVKDMPLSNITGTVGNWTLENFQRNCITRGLLNVDKTDKIIISDLDEIPNAKVLSQYLSESKPVVFSMRHHIYFFNAVVSPPIKYLDLAKKYLLSFFLNSYKIKLHRDFFWLGSIMVSFSDLDLPQKLRNNRENPKSGYIVAQNGGWHFTYMGGIDKIIEKLSALNQEFDYEPFKNETMIRNKIANKLNVLNNGSRFKIIKIDNTFPLFLVEHITRFDKYLYYKS
jgi:beta-1,4-mannosyl-glycoprotein beta-1,4-N-acetylglucosaminyltransferase